MIVVWMRKAYFPDVDEVSDDYDDEWFNSDDDDPELKEIRDIKKMLQKRPLMLS